MEEALQRGPVSDPLAKRLRPRLDIEWDREGLYIIPGWVEGPFLTSSDNRLNGREYLMEREMWLKLLRFVGTVALIIGGLCLFIVVLTATRAFLGSGEDLLSRYFVSIDYEEFLQGHNVVLTTSPGVDAHITVYVAKSIQKHWRSDDLRFVVQDPTTSRQLVHMDLSRTDDWGKVLRASEMSEPVGVAFDLVLPPEIAIGSKLAGVFSGTIYYPVVEGAGFRTQMRKVTLPINIAIVTEEELVGSIRSDFLKYAKILAAVAAPFTLIGLAVRYFTVPRRGAKASEPHVPSHQIPRVGQ
jgi:hypothetical protein